MVKYRPAKNILQKVITRVERAGIESKESAHRKELKCPSLVVKKVWISLLGLHQVKERGMYMV